MVKIIIDTDISLGTPGAEIDDGVALLMLLHSPWVEILGVTTVHGNVPVQDATTNTLRLMSLAGRPEIPVFEGCANPFVSDGGWSDFLGNWRSNYGPIPSWDGCPQSLPAVDAIIGAIEANPGDVSILALGPLTNLAMALRKAPHIAGMVRSVVAMGGSLTAASQPEFNIRCDPEAADIVFHAGWTLRIHGLEITRRPLFTPLDFETLDQSNPALALLAGQAFEWIPVVEAQGWETGGCSLHDAVAAAAFLKQDLLSYSTGFFIQVNLDFSPERGIIRALPGDRPTNLEIAVDIDAQACKAFILTQLSEV